MLDLQIISPVSQMSMDNDSSFWHLPRLNQTHNIGMVKKWYLKNGGEVRVNMAYDT